MKKSVLLPSTQQNINIVLAKTKLDPLTIVESLLKYDEKILKKEVCEMLKVTIPKDDEVKRMDEYNSFSNEELLETVAACDYYLFMLVNTSVYPAMRLNAMIFKYSYKIELIEILRSIESALKAFDYIKKNENFHKWLEVILAHGNYLNGTSNRGGAWGFRIDILAKLNELKTTDNKKTLMLYLVEYVGDVLKKDELFSVGKYIEKNFPKCILFLI